MSSSNIGNSTRRIVIGLAFSILVAICASAARAAGAEPASDASTEGRNALQQMFRNVGHGSELLPPDQAFDVSIRARGSATLVVDLKPAAGYYLYRDRIKFRIQSPPNITVANVELPRGEIKDDQEFGKVEVYRHPVQAIITLHRKNFAAEKLTLHATYQGCNEAIGVCYVPIEKKYEIAMPANE